MAHKRLDEDTKIVHIEVENAEVCLCGLLRGWTDQSKPVKEKFGSTCQSCIDEIREIKKLKVNK